MNTNLGIEARIDNQMPFILFVVISFVFGSVLPNGGSDLTTHYHNGKVVVSCLLSESYHFQE